MDIKIYYISNIFLGNRFKWQTLMTLKGINTEDNIYSCSSCGQTMDKNEIVTVLDITYSNEMFRIAQVWHNINMTDIETALVIAISLLSTGKCYAVMQVKLCSFYCLTAIHVCLFV